jgi:hypothetical protein
MPRFRIVRRGAAALDLCSLALPACRSGKGAGELLSAAVEKGALLVEFGPPQA